MIFNNDVNLRFLIIVKLLIRSFSKVFHFFGLLLSIIQSAP
jgi:hypothetical protein